MATIWHPLPGRLQSVSVADKNNIWGVTLDFQLCKFNSKTQQWQLVSVTSESINHARFSSSSAQSLQSAASTPSFSAAKRFSAFLPSLGLTSSTPSTAVITRSATMLSTTGLAQQQKIGGSSNKSIPNSPAMTRANSSSSLLATDTEEDTTFQVSAASDGTVVRLDRSLKAWYLIAPHNDHVDYEKDVIWINLGHFWKCVSVASISQIWGLSDCGDIYYGTSDRFALLEHAITSGAGYNKPTFTHISVGRDNLVVATDAHSGTVFRLKLHPTGACPPVWNALPGTGPGSRLHIVNCSLSTADFIVGIAKDGRVYRYSRSVWTPLGGGAKLENVGVGIDGYVLGVDRDGDLFGCQLESTAIVISPAPPLDRPSSREWTHKAIKDDELSAPSSPQAPNGPSLFNTPRQQSMSKRPTSSPRELFEMAASSSLARSSTFPIGEPRMDTSRITRTSSPLRESGGAGGAGGAGGVVGPGSGSSWAGSRAYTYSKTSGLNRTDSQMSKRSYASDIAIPKTPTGQSLSRPSTPTLSQDPDSDPALSSSAEQKAPVQAATAAVLPVSTPFSHPRVTPLRILTKGMFSSSPVPLSTDQDGESYFTSKPITTYGPLSNLSPLTSFPLNGNPYAAGSKPSSDTSNVQTPITPHSDGNNNFTLSDSSKSSSGSSNNLLTFPGQQNANSQDTFEDELREKEEEEEREENHPSTGNGPTPPSSSSSISPSVSALNRASSGVATGFVQQFKEHQQHPVLGEHIQRRQPNNTMVEYGQGLDSLPNTNGSIIAVETVEMAKRENECRDIHSIEHHDPLSPLTAAAVASATEIDPRQPFPLPPPATTQPAVVKAVVPSSPRQRMEFNRLLSSDKSEWVENGAHGRGSSGLGDRYNDMTNGVIIAGMEGQRNNDDNGRVWNGDTALIQPNLDQDKRNPSMAFSHLEQQQPSPSFASSSTTPATVPFQSPFSRNLPRFTTEEQQQQSRLETVPQDYFQPIPPFPGDYDTYNNINYRNNTTTDGQPRTASFLPWDNKQEFNDPSSSVLAVPLSERQFHPYPQQQQQQQLQQQEQDFGLEPPRQDLLSQHRPSDSSEVLMIQQQEYLRKTRLRSQPSSVVIANDPALRALSEKTEVLQDHHPLSDKTEIDYHHFGDTGSNNQFQQQLNQQSQQQQQNQFQHFPSPVARRLSEEYYQHFPSPAARRPSEEYYYYNNNNNNSASQPDEDEDDEMIKLRRKKKEMPPDGRRSSKYYPESPVPQEYVDALDRSRAGASTSVNNNTAASLNLTSIANNAIANVGVGSSNNSRSNSRRNNSANNTNINSNAIGEAPSHPSYSSTHLQKYVNTTMQQPHSHPPSGRSSVQSINLNPTNSVVGGYNFYTGPGSGSGSSSGSGSFNANGRNPYRQGSGSNGINHNNRTTTTVGSISNGVAPSTRSGGITGEDAQGRWVGSPTGADSRVATFGTSDVHKGRCCIIL